MDCDDDDDDEDDDGAVPWLVTMEAEKEMDKEMELGFDVETVILRVF